MFSQLKELFTLLERGQKIKFLVLQVLVLVMAFTELLGIASIGPFMAVVGDVSILERDNLLAQAYLWTGLASPHQFLILLGVMVLLALVISTIISMVTTWQLSLFASRLGAEIANRLFNFYLQQNWLFHASGSSAQLTKQLATETARLTNGVLVPLMSLNARLVFAVVLSISLILFDPLVALTGLIFFGLGYVIVYKVVKKRLETNGLAISEQSTQRYRLMSEGFGGVKDVLLLGRQSNFIQNFGKSSYRLACAEGTSSALSLVPRYFMELVAFSVMILLVLYLLFTHQGNLSLVLPTLSIYALAGFKLLPSFQQIYASITMIKGNVSSYEAIREDLLASKTNDCRREQNNTDKHLIVNNDIQLDGITFTYPGKTTPALNNLKMNIPVNSVIGIVGSSGSGKSTAIDVLLGLIQPQQGHLKIDGTIINDQNRRAWQNTIGFVPQSIFLSEGTIAENVAFGIPEKEIDLEQVKKALSLAHLEELVQSLDKGIHTKVGERGVQLSGGQRQRIGIARALYHEADVLVFDEATSALDGITEKMIMEAIHDFSGQKTIIMIAHRLKTVQKCDQIFFIEQGQVVDQGTYQELINKNEHFRKMAAHS